ncbi:histidinol phosphatase [Frigoribacterium sp. CFBP 13729]|uniref:inositol monophosphatase family protein n=1 Tax=Frigoribacterium sp. CFBP 13729 TaxID=2775293 RepID=UPI00177AC615|nr:inositol monophosphatase family protein [Frigoribacterium sp. CFBP 13729]MBD8609551.1 histidinol phosphatase [Frigoribacterium sp. CFBP 13729]
MRLALTLADAADAISTERYRSADLHVSLKPDRTHVTDADQAVERAIRAGIESERPDDSFYGEEYGNDAAGDDSAREDASATDGTGTRIGTGTGTGSGSGPGSGAAGHARAVPHRQWIVDPIDGTANFLRGVPVWATLISLVVDGVPVLGVVSAPALGRRWWASTGGGAFSSEHGTTPLRVSGVRDLADASLSYNGLDYWMDAGRLEQLLDLTRKVWRVRAYGDFWSYMLVAEGAVDMAGEFDLQPYDMAAVMSIIEEAGGRFTSADGEAGPWHGSALATNGLLHDDVLAVITASPDAAPRVIRSV